MVDRKGRADLVFLGLLVVSVPILLRVRDGPGVVVKVPADVGEESCLSANASPGEAEKCRLDRRTGVTESGLTCVGLSKVSSSCEDRPLPYYSELTKPMHSGGSS